jgi:hypothetical protein
MNIENLLENIKNAKSFSVDMCKNTITLELEVPGVQFNCNWSKQKLIEVIKENTLNASCNNVSMKDANKNQVQLPIYEYVLLKTDGYDVVDCILHS